MKKDVGDVYKERERVGLLRKVGGRFIKKDRGRFIKKDRGEV